MAENRYDGCLRKYNQEVVNLNAGNYILRHELAIHLKKVLAGKESRVLEIGVGEGDLTKFLLENNNNIKIDALDISPKMIANAKRNLMAFHSKLNFICRDFLRFSSTARYDAVVSALTLHNFDSMQRKEAFKKIFSLIKNHGYFILMDKIYPDDKKLREKSFNTQMRRYDYLDPFLKKKISDHEKQDYSPKYRMDESKILELLKKTGFRKINIIDRVERDVIISAATRRSL